MAQERGTTTLIIKLNPDDSAPTEIIVSYDSNVVGKPESKYTPTVKMSVLSTDTLADLAAAGAVKADADNV